MTYIDYLNRFNRWLDSNTLSSSAQLLYFKILDVFNRANWPECVQIDNRRLTLLADVYSEKSAIKARNELVEVGLIAYEQGKKGNPGKYSLSINTVNIHCNKYSEIITVNENSAIDSENDSKSLIYNNINNKTLEKTKNKTIYDSDFGKVYSAFADSIDPVASQFIIDELSNFYEKMDAECCLKAIEIAVSGGFKTKNWNYVKGILKKKLGRGVHSIDDWDKDEQNIKQNGFIPPTAEMVEEYCNEIERYIEVNKFLNYYNSVGWKRGNTPVTDWKALIASWADMNPEYEEREKNKKKKRRGRHIEIIDGQEVSVYDDE